MKKAFWIVLLVFVFTLSSSSAAEQRVYDNAGLFTAAQTSQIETEIASFQKENRLDFCVLTTDDYLGENYHKVVGEWFYDSLGLGIGPSYDGVLYWIDMSALTPYIVTTGDFLVRSALPNSKIEGIHDIAFSNLSKGEYDQAVLAVLNAIQAEIDAYLGN